MKVFDVSSLFSAGPKGLEKAYEGLPPSGGERKALVQKVHLAAHRHKVSLEAARAALWACRKMPTASSERLDVGVVVLGRAGEVDPPEEGFKMMQDLWWLVFPAGVPRFFKKAYGCAGRIADPEAAVEAFGWLWKKTPKDERKEKDPKILGAILSRVKDLPPEKGGEQAFFVLEKSYDVPRLRGRALEALSACSERLVPSRNWQRELLQQWVEKIVREKMVLRNK